MNTLYWFKSRFSSRGKALALYRRGMARAQEYDHQRAIDDYTVTIDMPDAPADVKAMSLYSRALVHLATGNLTKGVSDLDAVLAMGEAPVNVKRMARQELTKREQHASEST